MQLVRLLETLDPSEFLPLVISLLPEGPLAIRLSEAGVRVVPLEMRRRTSFLTSTIKLREEVRSFQPAIVHGWMYHGNLASWLGVRGLPGTPLVWTILQTLDDRNKERLGTRMVMWAGAALSRRTNAILYNSEVARTQHERAGFWAPRSVVIPNGFDVDAFRPAPEAKVRLRGFLGIPGYRTVVGLVNRYHPMKGHTVFLKAARVLLDSGLDASFVCAGRKVTLANPELRRAVHELRLADRVHLLGEQADTAALFAGFDVTCCPSLWGEGFPNVVGESMACGTPCVVTRVGDAPLVVGPTGVVVAPGDPVALANAVRSLLQLSESESRALRLAARERIVNRFPLRQYAVAHAQLYRRLVAGT
jgi:glycosyltransferase involved in cell wall biosynthesis